MSDEYESNPMAVTEDGDQCSTVALSLRALQEAKERRLRESIACDLLEIGAAVTVAKPPETAKTPEQRNDWRFWWLLHCLYGYCDTDLGTPHGSGEDMSGWREDATAQGIDVSLVDGTSGEEDARAREQRRLYAEAMAPRIAEQMLDGMRGEG